jgi:phosphoglycolate phosphatase
MPYRLPLKLNKELATKLLKDLDNFLFDCDGVIWNHGKAIDGSIELVNRLKQLGKRCFFVTNNSTKTCENVIELLKKNGVANVVESDIVCTSWILARYLQSIDFQKPKKAYVIGSAGIAGELDKAHIDHIGIGDTSRDIPDPAKFDYVKSVKLDPDVKCVVVGFDYYFNYPKMVIATSYASNPDCLFIATNDDAQFPSGIENNPIVIPGTGSIVQAMRTSVGREPLVLGKPHKTMWNVLESLHKLDPSRTCMVGDRLDTDIAFAANCSLGYSLAVLTGVTNEPEIMKVSKTLQDQNNNNEEAKCVPDFYTESLGTFYAFIQDA